MKIIKYYENTKYALKKGKKKSAQMSCVYVLYVNVRIEMHRKRNIGAECECIAKISLTYSMKLLKYIP